MTDEGVSSSTTGRSIKDRLTFNWPVKSPSKGLRPENKLPVKQRVVFPNDRLKGNSDNDNSKRSQPDDDWNAMAAAFRNPEPNAWTGGTVKGKKRRKNSWNNWNKGNSIENEDHSDWPYSSNTNGNDRNGSQTTQQNSVDWGSWDQSTSRESNSQNLETKESSGNDGPVQESDHCDKFISSKSIATQTDSTAPRSVAVQTDPKPTIYGHQETAYNHYAEILTLTSPTMKRPNGIPTLGADPQPGPSQYNPLSTSVTKIIVRPSQPVSRDPRVARKSKSFQSISPN